jgi:hypothetical protein
MKCASAFSIQHSTFSIQHLAPKKKRAVQRKWTARDAPGMLSALLFICLFFFQFSQALADFLQIFLQVLGLLLQNVAFLLGSRRCRGRDVVKRSSAPVGEAAAETTAEASTAAKAAAEASAATEALTEASAATEAQPATTAAAKAKAGVRKARNRKTCAETCCASRFCTLTQWACSISSWHNYTLLFLMFLIELRAALSLDKSLWSLCITISSILHAKNRKGAENYPNALGENR